ncbi:hypothetical protein DKX38_001850 [Salix brachista]|uniref:Uncharacterized protein n=1 Tax=Salix brachista TaxID=2182728 RepID=A0A5N5NLZ2_9ROSI|nr:hypothetical protein DKX38_001850 [Salix brachista]
MVGVFKRSLSFPHKTPACTPSEPSISYHNRSISLPCRSHPLISQLKNEINELKTWSSKFENRTCSWLCDALIRLKDVQHSLDDILQLPQTRESLRRQPKWVEKLLEDFLRFIDVYGIFRTLVMAVKDDQAAAQVAIRKKDDSKIALYMRSRKKMAREMVKLVSTVRCIARCPFPGSDSGPSAGDAELVGVIIDVIEVSALVSFALFNGISLSLASRKSSWIGLMRLRKKVKIDEGIQEFQQIGVESLRGLREKRDGEVRMVLKRMQEFEGCIGDIETSVERVFRSLINTRVENSCRVRLVSSLKGQLPVEQGPLPVILDKLRSGLRDRDVISIVIYL